MSGVAGVRTPASVGEYACKATTKAVPEGVGSADRDLTTSDETGSRYDR